jgi:competence protein ComEC
MRTGMMALALGLLACVLPALPPVWLCTLLPVIGLMLLPFGLIQWRFSCSV